MVNFFELSTFSNPLNSAAIILTPLNLTLPRQYPVEGTNLYMRVQVPPLPLPVDASTPDNPLHTQVTLENITHVQPERLRLAWKHVSEESEEVAC